MYHWSLCEVDFKYLGLLFTTLSIISATVKYLLLTQKHQTSIRVHSSYLLPNFTNFAHSNYGLFKFAADFSLKWLKTFISKLCCLNCHYVIRMLTLKIVLFYYNLSHGFWAKSICFYSFYCLLIQEGQRGEFCERVVQRRSGNWRDQGIEMYSEVCVFHFLAFNCFQVTTGDICSFCAPQIHRSWYFGTFFACFVLFYLFISFLLFLILRLRESFWAFTLNPTFHIILSSCL